MLVLCHCGNRIDCAHHVGWYTYTQSPRMCAMRLLLVTQAILDAYDYIYFRVDNVQAASAEDKQETY